ncbi:hypothetical protein ONZ51_g2248 [Trametes cubensis]|uniref:Uncharacterized protein n=1 Tax=Trametes cubensis TaxID=1111947 RepID=A0AAD7XF14_9APHY|nr:hypothetical protein ONZ51_g2248 [Trametes cubensis]
MKAKRSMYAQTLRERAAILEAVEACEWNREEDPVAVFVEDGEVVGHDFRQGPCRVPLSFTFRNLSLTHPARVTLKLAENAGNDRVDNLLPPSYAGRLVHRTVLEPSQSYTAHAKLWATRPGCYALDSWTVETEVGEPPAPSQKSPGQPAEADKTPQPTHTSVWRSRQLRYLQRPPAGGARPFVTVVDTGRLG